MATQQKQATSTLFGREVSYGMNRQWNSYWLLFLRLIMGWWFLASGLSKIVEHGAVYDAEGWMLHATDGTIVYPIMEFVAQNAIIVPNIMIPWGQLLIGLGLILGCLTRLAAANGAILMFFFYFGNAGWENGFVNGDLLGLLLFLTIIVFAAGRVWGIDSYLEETDFVKNRPKLRYILG